MPPDEEYIVSFGAGPDEEVMAHCDSHAVILAMARRIKKGMVSDPMFVHKDTDTRNPRRVTLDIKLE